MAIKEIQKKAEKAEQIISGLRVFTKTKEAGFPWEFYHVLALVQNDALGKRSLLVSAIIALIYNAKYTVVITEPNEELVDYIKPLQVEKLLEIGNVPAHEKDEYGKLVSWMDAAIKEKELDKQLNVMVVEDSTVVTKVLEYVTKEMVDLVVVPANFSQEMQESRKTDEKVEKLEKPSEQLTPLVKELTEKLTVSTFIIRSFQAPPKIIEEEPSDTKD